MGILADAPLLTTPATDDLVWVYDISVPSTPDKSMEMTAFGDLMLRSDVLLVDANFDYLDGNWNRFTTIGAALATCSGGETILIAPGIYTADVTISVDNIKLIGSGAPTFDDSSGRLVNGTIIRGRIALGTTLGSVIKDLGVDLVGVDSKDCIASTAGSEIVNRTFENLTIIGNGDSGLSHGMYVSGHNNIVNNVRVYRCYHGIAIHGSYTNLSNAYIYSCHGGFSLVIKAKLGNPVRYVNVTNVIIEGDPSSASSLMAGQLELQTANSSPLDHINITNVSANYTVNMALQIEQGDGTGTISDVIITNMQSDNCYALGVFGDFRFEYGSSIQLIGCRSTNRGAGYGFNNVSASDVSLVACQGDGSGSGDTSGTFTRLEMNTNVTLTGTMTPQYLTLTHGGIITIAGGVITPTASFHYVDTEGAAATDDLDTINGWALGKIMVIQAASSSRAVVVKNGTGNIDCKADITLNKNRDAIMFIGGNGNRWERLSFGDNL